MLLNVQLFGPFEEQSLGLPLSPSLLLLSEFNRHIGVRFAHVTTKSLGLVESSVFAHRAGELPETSSGF